jgi:iron complex outermembrane receptor protein
MRLSVVMVSAVLANLAHAQEKIAEVVVTAQKRSESASRTPVALTALTAADLDKLGVANAADLTNVVPNVQIGTADAGNTNIYIRGIGSNNTTESGDPAAAFHLDGVYLGRPDEARTAFFDVTRVEVLRGPQGTLYGRNATAGAVNVISAKPEDTLGGKFSVEIGNHDLRRTDGVINVPVNDLLALRVAAMGEHRENYVRTAAPNNNQNTTGARVHALIKYAKDGSLLLSADQTKIRGPNNAGVLLPLADDHGDAGQTNLNTLAAAGEADYRGLTAEWNQELGAATLTYLVSHRNRSMSSSSTEIGGFGPSFSFSSSRAAQTSHEARLSSLANSPWKWVAGLYAYNEEQHTTFSFSNGVLTGGMPDFKSSSRAAFGQLTYAVTPALRITGGLRSTRDTKSSVNGTSVFTLFGPPVASITNADHAWKKTDGKLGVDFDLAKGTLLYANVATGYKAGGFNSANAASNYPVTYYSPEKLTSVEGGLKTRILDGAGQFNVALFHYGYKDLQVGTIVSVAGGAGVSTVNNAATATVNGAEADVKIRVSGSDTFDGSMSYTKATYDEFKNCVYEPTNTLQDCSGNMLRNAPKFKLTLGYEHRIPVGEGTVTLRADTRYSGKYFNDDTNSPLFRQDSYTRSGLSARYDAPEFRYFVTAYVRNLENRNVMVSRFPAVVGSASGYFAAPRTFGMSVGTAF